MPRAEVLESTVKEFGLDIESFRVMPVYWINTPDYRNGFKGAKGTPEELQGEVDRIIKACTAVDEDINIYTPGSARNFLYRNQIGIDCSGFAYHLLNRSLNKEKKESLGSRLFVPKGTVVFGAQKESWKAEHELTEKEKDALPDLIPMEWVCKTFNREPQFLTNVASFSNDQTSSVVDVSDASPGDLIIMKKNNRYKHMAVVTQVNGNELKVWDSYRKDDGYGGVTGHDVRIREPDQPLSTQEWENFDTNRYDEYIMRRIKI